MTELESIAKSKELTACAALVHNPYEIGTRYKCAVALRAWRKVKEFERAKWLRYHISYVGYPLKTTLNIY